MVNEFKYVIINIPIRDYDIQKIIDGLVRQNRICDKNIQKTVITNKYFLTDYTNNLEMIQIHLNNKQCNGDVSSLKNISKKIQKSHSSKLCSITCFFDKKTIKKLKSFLDKKSNWACLISLSGYDLATRGLILLSSIYFIRFLKTSFG